MQEYHTEPTGNKCLPKEHSKTVDAPIFLEELHKSLKKAKQ